jgi:hypothetical protein
MPVVQVGEIETNVKNNQGVQRVRCRGKECGEALSIKGCGDSPARKGEGGGLLISCARATRGLRKPSLDARSGMSSRQLSREQKTRELGGTYFYAVALGGDQFEHTVSLELRWWIPVGLCRRLARAGCLVRIAILCKGGVNAGHKRVEVHC